MDIFQAIIIAIVEGISEFLPISSTGHMIIASSLMGIASDDFTKMFTVAIQFGAILSVLVLYWKRFFQSIEFYFKLLVAFIPAAIIGKLFNDDIDKLLESVTTVGITLVLGGIILLYIDKWMARNESNEELAADSTKKHSLDDRLIPQDVKENTNITYKKSFIIGLFQCIAMIPGVSRSAATIIGGMTQKLNRKTAAEFSFFLAVPTMFAATGYKMYKFFKQSGGFTTEQYKLLAVGNLVAFIVALIAIKTFIGYLSKHGFKVFGYYRIIVGLAIILLSVFGNKLQIV